MNIKIIGSINEDAYIKFSNELDKAKGPVKVELHSEGGHAQDGLAFYGKIRSHKNPVHIIAHGIVHSSAVLVLAAADYREASEEVQVMIHDSRETFKNATLDELLCAVDRVEREEKQWAKLLEGRTATPADVWRQLSRKETYMDVKEALQFGLIHKILKGKK